MQTQSCCSKEWEQLVLPHQGLIGRMALKLTRNPDDAADLSQEVLLKVIQSEHLYQPGTNIKGWLTTIVRNMFITSYQKAKKRGISVDVAEYTGHGIETHSSLNDGVSELLSQELQLAMDSLPTRLKAIMTDRIHGYKYEELAVMHTLPIGTIKNKIHIARELLTKHLTRPKSTQKTILSVPMAFPKADPAVTHARWRKLLNYLDNWFIQIGNDVPLDMVSLARELQCSVPQAGQLVMTLVTMEALSKKKDPANAVRNLYSPGSTLFSEVDIETAQRTTSQHIQKSRSDKTIQFRTTHP